MDFESLRKSAVHLFGDMVPRVDTKSRYSFGWSQTYPGDVSMDVIIGMANAESIPDAIAMLDKLGEDGYQGFMANIVMADS